MLVLAPYVPGLLRRKLFINKCCIAEDAESQLNAIRHASHTLRNSRSMILLWGPGYFDSLACVHEFATFIHVHGDSREVDFVPVYMPLFTVSLFLFHACIIVAQWAVVSALEPEDPSMKWTGTDMYSFAVVRLRQSYVHGIFIFLVPSFGVWQFARYYMGQRRRLQEQLSSFSVERAGCFLETHREALVADIAEQFGSVATFDRFVQCELPQRVDALRNVPVPLLASMVGAFPALFMYTNIISGALWDGDAQISARALVAIPLVCVCAHWLLLNLVLLLAGQVPAERNRRPCSSMRARWCWGLLGPLASAAIAGAVCPVSFMVLCPVLLPIWGAVLILLAMLSAVAALYWQDHAPAKERAAALAGPQEVTVV
jgi:hypothetical protein